jgi:hypothetical protein
MRLFAAFPAVAFASACIWGLAFRTSAGSVDRSKFKLYIHLECVKVSDGTAEDEIYILIVDQEEKVTRWPEGKAHVAVNATDKKRIDGKQVFDGTLTKETRNYYFLLMEADDKAPCELAGGRLAARFVQNEGSEAFAAGILLALRSREGCNDSVLGGLVLQARPQLPTASWQEWKYPSKDVPDAFAYLAELRRQGKKFEIPLLPAEGGSFATFDLRGAGGEYKVRLTLEH